jgi:hypothetical protein
VFAALARYPSRDAILFATLSRYPVVHPVVRAATAFSDRLKWS